MPHFPDLEQFFAGFLKWNNNFVALVNIEQILYEIGLSSRITTVGIVEILFSYMQYQGKKQIEYGLLLKERFQLSKNILSNKK